ncbi:MAG: hypothetical protein IKA89_08170, partial [Anaerotignum sp.]|nr:hypothetical protein [Anaerotignum sp.]
MKLKKMLAAVLTMAMVATALPVTAFAMSTLPTADANGMITLTENVVLTEGYEVDGTVTLDLNGHSITPAAGDAFTKGDGKEDYLLAVKRGGTLTIMDSRGNGIIDGSSNSKIVCAVKMTIYGESANGDDATLIVDGAAIKGAPYGISGNGNRHNTSVTIKSGTVEGVNVGIFQPQDGKLVIEGGTIKGATGVEVRDGEVKVTNGTITGTGTYSLSGTGNGNTTAGVGLAVVTHDGRDPKATVTGGTIGGAVGVVASASDSRDANVAGAAKEGDATVTLAGGNINADSYGVRVLDGSTVTLSGARVVSNDFGVYVRGLGGNGSPTTLNVTGGSIEAASNAIAGNGSNKEGKGLYDNTEINISGGTITSKNDNAIYQPQKGVLNISGGTITGKSGVYAKDGTVNVSGNAEITGTGDAKYSASGDGATGTGAAIVLESSTAKSYGVPVANITGGIMNGNASSDAKAIETYKAEGNEGTDDADANVSGGTFSTPVAPEMLDTDADYVVPTGDGYSYFTNQATAEAAAQAAGVGTNVYTTEGGNLNADGSVNTETARPVYTAPEPTPEPTPSTPKKSTKKYSVSVDTDEIENGSIKLSSSKVKKGATVTLTVTPDAGYELDKLVVLDKDGDVVELTDKGDGKFTFKMPRGGVEVDASFVEADAVVVKDTAKIVLTIDSIVALVNGEPVVNDVAPIIKGERTFLPIRLIAEELGATVTWNEAEQSVTIVKDDMGIVIYIGQAFALVNGEPVQ